MTLETRQRTVSAVLVVLTLSTITACTKPSAEAVESQTVVTVKTAPAVLGDIRGVVHATGIVSPAPGAELVVVAPEAARIAEIPHAAGDRVRQGDVLVRFEIPSMAADVQKQQAEVSRAQATLDNARAAQTRAHELFERGVAARKEVEESNRAVSEAEAALAQARAAEVAALAVAGRATVRSTFDGIVAKRLHNPGDLVEAAASDSVLRVIDPRRLEIVASVPLADVSRIAVGARGHLAGTPMDTRDLDLRVVSLPAVVDVGTPTVPVRLAVVGSMTLPTGTPVQVDVEAEHHAHVVLIPAVAIVREGDETAVFVAREAKAERRPVRLGLASDKQVEVVAGVSAGEQVIVDGQAGLPNDTAITVSEDTQGAKEDRATEKDDGK